MAKIRLVFLIIFLFCFSLFIDSKLQKKDFNLLIISIDSLRPDHLKIYGYDRETYPTLYQYSQNASVFTNSYTQVPQTTSSFQALMTGRDPFKTGQLMLAKKLPTNIGPTIAEIFKNKGYLTAAFYSNHFLADNLSGLKKGFDVYDYINYQYQNICAAYENKKTKQAKWGDSVVQKAVDWLKDNHHKKFMLWVHFNDVHLPYNFPNENKSFSHLTNSQIDDLFSFIFFGKLTPSANVFKKPSITENLMNAYDDKIRFVDDQIKTILKKMNEYGINDKTIVVIHSDHGEGFDHGKVLYHSSNIYNSALRVALIIKDPLNRVPKEINLPVTLTNIFSFLINLTNSKYKYTEIINNNKNIYYSTDQSPPYVSCSNKITKPANKYATVDFPYKLIYHLNENNPQENDFELYNLYNDPKEEKDIKMTETKILNNLKSKLLSFITRHQKQVNSTESNQNVSNTLKSLGY